MTVMLSGGPDGQPLNWKFNRIIVPSFFINSYQQDYFVPGVVNLGWLVSCTGMMYSSTSFPKPERPIEVYRDLLLTNAQTSTAAKICWLQNDTMLTGTWGQTQQASLTGLANPGPGVVYTSPVGQPTMPQNPITQITDPNGNLWVVTTYGTCGNSQPSWPATPVYPTLQSPNTVATTVTDGSVVWTAINPKGQGFRLNPMPPATGVIWQIRPEAQARVPRFTSLGQVIDPVPDDFSHYFKEGFYAQLYRRSPDPKVRARFADEWKIWLKSLDNAVKKGQREMDDFGFVPSSQLMDTGWAYNPVNPAQPYGPWQG
jgi:hypothetical protein